MPLVYKATGQYLLKNGLPPFELAFNKKEFETELEMLFQSAAPDPKALEDFKNKWRLNSIIAEKVDAYAPKTR